MKDTDPGELIANLDAGVFAQQLGHALSAVAGAVVDHGKAGKVVITLDMKRIGESSQVNITHKLDFVQPTKRGNKREDYALATPMYVTANGLQLFNTDPTGQIFKREDTPVPART